MQKTDQRQQLELVAALAIAALTIWMRSGANTIIWDDSYISFRYVLNAVTGHGLVFNAGERVMGASCPLYLLLLMPFAVLHCDLPSVATGVGVFCDMLTAVCLLYLGTRALHPFAGCVAATLFALSPKAVICGLSGMETSFYIALIVGVSVAMIERQTYVAAALAGFAAVTRPEGMLWGFALLIVLAHALRKPPFLEALIVGLPLLAWCAFAMRYYGSIIPESVIAKHISIEHYKIPWRDAAFLIRYAIEPNKWINEEEVVRFSGTDFLVLALMAIGGVRIWRCPDLRPLLIGTLLYLCAYAAPNQYLFYWYYTPLLPCAVLLIAAGSYTLLNSLKCLETSYDATIVLRPRGGESMQSMTFPLNGWLLLTVFAVSRIYSVSWVNAHNTLLGSQAEWHAREENYLASGSWIARNYGVMQPVAACEIGAFGWAYPGRVVDLCGLVSPEVLSYLKRYGLSPDATNSYLREHRPPVFVSSEVINNATDFSHYRLKATWPFRSEAYGLNVYVYDRDWREK